MVKLTGDVTPDMRAVAQADLERVKWLLWYTCFRVVKLTGDVTPDMRAVAQADLERVK